MKSSNNKPRNWVLQKREKLYLLNPKNPWISKLVVEKTPEPCAKTESKPPLLLEGAMILRESDIC